VVLGAVRFSGYLQMRAYLGWAVVHATLLRFFSAGQDLETLLVLEHRLAWYNAEVKGTSSLPLSECLSMPSIRLDMDGRDGLGGVLRSILMYDCESIES